MMYDEYLRGRDGAQYWEYDSHGRRLAEYRPARKEPVAGDNVYLTHRLRSAAPRRAVLHRERVRRLRRRPRSAQRRSAGHGLVAGVQSERLLEALHARRLEDHRLESVQDRAESRHPGPLLARLRLQGRHGHGRTVRRRDRHRHDRSTAAAAASSSAAVSAAGRRTATATSASRNALKVSCDIFFYNTGARLGVDKIAEYAHKLDLRRDLADRSRRREGRASSRRRSGPTTKQHRKWYPSRDDLRRHRPGSAHRHAAAGGEHDGRHRQRRHGLPAARRDA